MAPWNAQASLFPARNEPRNFARARHRWLIQMRWMAMVGILAVSVLGYADIYRGLHWRLSTAVASLGLALNAWLWWLDRRQRQGDPRGSGLTSTMLEALLDMLLLSGMLWAAGGLSSPFVAFFVLHVAIVGIVGGPRAVGIAVLTATACVAALASTHLVPALRVGAWDPMPPFDVITAAGACLVTVASAAYMVVHATRELRDREAALAEALGQEGRLVLTERLVSLGRVAQGVAHELNTPLATIRTLASDMRSALKAMPADTEAERATAADLDESAALIHEETKRLGRITQSLLAGGDLHHARIDGSVSLGAVAERARMIVFAGGDPEDVVDIARGLDHVTAAADPDRLMQVLVNLLQNARDATRDAPTPRIHVHGRATGGTAELIVEDNGVGIDEAAARRIFEPFFTTKAKGTGLGLYTSYMLVRRMGGDLRLEPRPGGGARATVVLPLASADRGGVAPGARPSQPPAAP